MTSMTTTGTGARSGADYIASLRDDRAVWIDGERIKDVTKDHRFRGAVQSIADLYDLQCDPALRDRMTFASPSSGKPVGLSFLLPRSAEDLRRRRDMMKTWMDAVGGMMGRTPDFLNVMVSAHASAHELFAAGGERFGRNITSYHEHIRENDLALTHSLVSPDIDKRKAMFEQPGEMVMRVVRETDAGIHVSGARSVATLGPLANEVLIMPAAAKFPLVEDAEAYAVGFAARMDTPGMKMICRPSLPAKGHFANDPLSARMDEMDAVIWFDNAFIPWERVFMHRSIKAVETAMKSPSGPHGSHQSATRSLAKMEFLLGIAYNLADVNHSRFPQVMVQLSELVAFVETLRALLRVAEVDCVPGPGGTVVPYEQPLNVVRAQYPAMHARALEILQLLGAGNVVVAPSVEDLRSASGPAIERYCAGADIPAERKMQLMRLAWDASCSSFAGRQNLYEKFFSGDPWRNAQIRAERYPGAREAQARVWAFLDRNEEWQARINADLPTAA
ncbi:4-hydroxyphenylacetate 3-hydroxylase family protein [Pelomonas sp. KK5]|uniref:4-hydroxyphenylacetate 3-hydroxylase family protein n=1 Tax=Pelomonas sp. KK5 TaxID=1855730 RepID=UPI00097C271F|nr:4-hydroxyphenylacetate 3-hydroxylase N-terminal domain-containing protein [Pelomonas sp. KK5]